MDEGITTPNEVNALLQQRLLPMLLETSIQVQFLIPMAISLGFGILFGSFIILFLVPALLTIVDDMKNIGPHIRSKLWRRLKL